MKKIIVIFIILNFMTSILLAKDKLQLKIGTLENPPKIFTAENGEISGFWADIMNYIADEEEWEIEWVHGYWNQCLQRLENNEIDILIDTGFTEPRSKKFAFSNETVLLSWTRLYTSKDSDINSILDLEGKRIAGLKGSFNLDGPEGLKDIIKRFEINCTVIEMDDYIKVFEALDEKEIDAGITNKDFGHLHENDFDVERTPIIFQPARMLFAFPKNSKLTPKLIEKIDFHIRAMKKDNNSIYYQSMDRYLGGAEKITVFPSWIKWISLITLVIIVLIMGVNYLLKRKVKEKTLELEQDIIERKRAEEQTRIKDEQLRTIMEASQDYIWLLDKEFNILYGNRTGSAQNIADVIGISILSLLPKEMQAESRNHLKKALTSKNFYKYEVEIQLEDGSSITFENIAVPMKSNGEVVGLTINTRDITERKLAEAELEKHREHLEELIKERTAELEEKNKKLGKSQQSLALLLKDVNESREELDKSNKKLEEKAKTLEKSRKSLALLLEDVNESRVELDLSNKKLNASNKELEAFSYSVSHDLRAPLRHIDGFTKLLNKKIKNKIDEKSQNYFDNIINSSKQMNQLIDDLLIFSRMGRKDVKKTNINMKTVVDDAIQEFESDIKENNISIKIDDMPEVYLDVSLLRQAWVNLISNAIKFTSNEKNPEIHIGTDKDKNGNIIFFIKDNGVGFDQKYVDKIFGVFQRLHNINEFPGTGIGLANVKRIIMKHSGNIRAEGKINIGASFFFTLSDN